MPYALFENDEKMSRAFPTEADVWRRAEEAGLVSTGLEGAKTLDEGLVVKPCAPDPDEPGEPAEDWIMPSQLT